jgi:hypothetical protein
MKEATMKQHLLITMMVGLGSLITSGCSDDSSGGGTGGSSGNGGISSTGGGTTNASEAIKKCNDFLADYCEYSARCLEAEKNIDQSTGYDLCIKGSGIDCSTIKQVTNSYDVCMSAVGVSTCPTSLPSSCNKVFLK